MAPSRQGDPRIPHLVHSLIPPLLQYQDRFVIDSPRSHPEPHSNFPFTTLAIAGAHGLGGAASTGAWP
jgi:hypothetical protein